MIGAGAQVFIDLKLHDIPNTVERASAQIAKLGATFLTVHAYPQTMRAALAGAAGSGLGVLGVSVLTSADDADLAEARLCLSARALVSRRAAQAEAIGLAGLVASAAEVAGLRAEGPQVDAGVPGDPPDRRRGGGPEARGDAGSGDCGRGGLSGGRPADHGRRRSAGGGGGDCR